MTLHTSLSGKPSYHWFFVVVGYSYLSQQLINKDFIFTHLPNNCANLAVHRVCRNKSSTQRIAKYIDQQKHISEYTYIGYIRQLQYSDYYSVVLILCNT